jgi:hypothetical protein
VASYGGAVPMSYDCCVRIERMANGYSVTVKDPKLVKENAKPNGRYVNPEREYAFKTVAEVKKFLDKNLDKALPNDDPDPSFDATFDKAAAAAVTDKD